MGLQSSAENGGVPLAHCAINDDRNAIHVISAPQHPGCKTKRQRTGWLLQLFADLGLDQLRIGQRIRTIQNEYVPYRMRKTLKIEVVHILEANLTSSRPMGMPAKVANESCSKTGRSTFFQPERTVKIATVQPTRPISETEVEKLSGSSASSGILTTESPKPKTARISEPKILHWQPVK